VELYLYTALLASMAQTGATLLLDLKHAEVSVSLMLCQTPTFVCVSCDIARGLVLTCFDECLIAEEIAYGCPAITAALGASNLGVSQQSI
jgi:hypothetical protein